VARTAKVYLAGAGFRAAGSFTSKALLLQQAAAIDDRPAGDGILLPLRNRIAEGAAA
jgi:hypothetical protein